MREISPANRISEVSEYYFSVKLREIAQMNAEGADVINLGIGSPDLPPAEEVVSTLGEEAARETSHGYQPYIGIPELRNAFSAWYRRWYGVELDPASEILPLIGSKEGIMHISMAFVNEGDAVLVPNPGYPTYTSVSRLVGAKIIPYDLSAENNWEPDLEALEAQHAAGEIDLNSVKLLWCNYPNMPTGANGSIPLFERLVAFGRKYNIIICHDNPYSFILNDKPLSILMVEGAKDICIELNSMSKSHNMPGWRIGMIAANATFISWILKVKSNIDSGMYRAMQLAAVKALDAEAGWYEGNNANYASRRHVAEEIMDALGCTYDKKQVGMFLWGRIPDSCNDVEDLTERVLHEARVFITPGFIFGTNGKRYIRISLCAKEEKLAEALERIKNIM